MQDSKGDPGVKNRLLDSVGEHKGVMIWENSTETYLLPYVKQMASASWCMKQGTQSQCSRTTQRKGVQDGGHMCTRGWFMPMYGRNHHNIVK